MYDTTDIEYPNVRKVKWTNIGEWAHPSQAVMKTLTDITIYTDYVAKLNALVDDADTEQEDTAFPEYTPEKLEISGENACLLYAPQECQDYQAVQKFRNSYVHFSTDRSITSLRNPSSSAKGLPGW